MLKRLLRQLFPNAGPRPHHDVQSTLRQAMDLMRRHEYAAAETCCLRIVQQEPSAADAWELLGAIALAEGDANAAQDRFEAALKLNGERSQTLCNAAEASRQAGNHARALELSGKVLAQDPDNSAALHVRGLALQSCWRLEEALELYRSLVEAHPEQVMPYTSYLFLLVLLGRNALEVRAEHVRWAKVHAEALTAASIPCANSPDPSRRLRVGYVSADFREHAANRFIEPILSNHDPARFDVYCYSNVEKSDAVTGRFRTVVQQWRDIRWDDDAAAAGRIRDDAIDILVDLSGHTGGNRLGIFALKPAPVQVTYLGYPATTGMSAMDWRLTDATADPVPTAEPNYTERLLRLPHSLWCFRPDPAMPEPGPPPSSLTGRITFASPNSIFKLTPRIIALWSRLLLSVPGSRLLLATIPAGEARERLVAEFAGHGVPIAYLSLVAPMARERFWTLYADIDIALDTWPCNGGATTCETLWSGVPVVSLAGDLFQSRAGLSLLTAVGLPELAAHSDEQYLRIARELALDPARLARLRSGLRERMLASPLLDEHGFTRDLESLYESAWRDWRARRNSPADMRPASGANADPTGAKIEEGLRHRAEGRTDDARAAFESAAAIDPGSSLPLMYLGNIDNENGRFDDAARSYRQALGIDPHNAALHYNLALTLLSIGDAAGAAEAFRRSLEEAPDYGDARSSLLFTLNLSDRATPAEVAEAHFEWGRLVADPMYREREYANLPDRSRRLRIGYVSADFFGHSAESFIHPILNAHSAAQCEVFCYVNAPMQAAAAGMHGHIWRDVHALDDGQLAALVARDTIDILVDLSGHSRGNRLLAFAQRPAPVQMTYLGYPNTTGMRAIDFRITDALCDPPGTSESRYRERLLRMPCSLWNYRPQNGESRSVSSLPALASGHVTFGALNNIAKLNRGLIDLWCQILKRVPGARMIVATIRPGDAQRHIARMFAEGGVGPDRIEFRDRTGRDQFLALHDKIDVALDSFPCNGGATTCDSLWQGVPVISLTGEAFPSRAGLSILAAVGLPHLAAGSAAEYVDLAAGLAGDLPALGALRAGMRERMRASVLMDSAGFVRDLETLYRQAWHEWCDSGA